MLYIVILGTSQGTWMVMKARICIGRYSYRPDVDSGLRILGGSSWSVMEFHLRVPPEKWCITKAEFFAFVEEIRSLWESGRWKIDWHGTAHSGYSHSTSSSATRRFTQFFSDEVTGCWAKDVSFLMPLCNIIGWDRFGSVRSRFPGTGEFPVPGSVRFLGI